MDFRVRVENYRQLYAENLKNGSVHIPEAAAKSVSELAAAKSVSELAAAAYEVGLREGYSLGFAEATRKTMDSHEQE